MQSFVARANVARFRLLLSEAKSDEERAEIQRLLDEELKKLLVLRKASPEA